MERSMVKYKLEVDIPIESIVGQCYISGELIQAFIERIVRSDDPYLELEALRRLWGWIQSDGFTKFISEDPHERMILEHIHAGIHRTLGLRR